MLKKFYTKLKKLYTKTTKTYYTDLSVAECERLLANSEYNRDECGRFHKPFILKPTGSIRVKRNRNDEIVLVCYAVPRDSDSFYVNLESSDEKTIVSLTTSLTSIHFFTAILGCLVLLSLLVHWAFAMFLPLYAMILVLIIIAKGNEQHLEMAESFLASMINAVDPLRKELQNTDVTDSEQDKPENRKFRILRSKVMLFFLGLILFTSSYMGFLTIFTISSNLEEELAALVTVEGTLRSYRAYHLRGYNGFISLNEDDENYNIGSVHGRYFSVHGRSSNNHTAHRDCFQCTVKRGDPIRLLVHPKTSSNASNIQVYAVSSGSRDFLTLEDTVRAIVDNRQLGVDAARVFFAISAICIVLLAIRYFLNRKGDTGDGTFCQH